MEKKKSLLTGGAKCVNLCWRRYEKGAFEVPCRFVPGGVCGLPCGSSDRSGSGADIADVFCGNGSLGGVVYHPQGTRGMTVSAAAVGLVFILFIAVAGFIVWKFVPDDTRR